MEVPSKIGKYKIIKKLGEGASGCVLEAQQEIINRHVALKILFSHLLKAKPTIIKRFQREACLASSLVHPNIVPIFEIAEHKGMHFYTMQHIEGRPMTDCIGDKRLTINNKIDIFIELCDALALAHDRNIIHRDLKPHNVIITKHLNPVILDFGIAKSLMDDDNMTQAGHILGSAHYMAPEQAGPGEVGTFTDVFALGVMIYEMISSQRPFHGENVKDLIIKRIHYREHPELYKPVSLREAMPELPEFLDKIVFKSLEAEPINRYQTAGELLEDLKKLRRELSLKRSLDKYQEKNH